MKVSSKKWVNRGGADLWLQVLKDNKVNLQAKWKT